MALCQHRHFNRLFVINNYTIVECNDCGMRKTSPVPSPEQIEDTYSEKFYSKKNSARFIPVAELLVKLFRFLRAFEIVHLYRPDKVLDVGCGRGLMLHYLKKYFKVNYVTGTQFSQTVIDYAKRNYDIELKKGELRENIDSIETELDFISFWHVLEHIDNVDHNIELCRCLLRDSGLLLIEVPNSESFSQRLLKTSWMGWDIPNHLSHFTPASLANLLERHGFKIVGKNYFSLEYSIFTSIQSFLNWISGKHNLLYNSIFVDKKNKRFSIEVFAHLILVAVLMPWAFFINIVLYNNVKGECIHYVAQKI